MRPSSLFNDLMDLEADRRHPTKRNRPLASGALTLAQGGLLFAGLFLAGGLLGMALGPMFAGTCLLYFCGTMLYSFWLKRKPIVDICTLACLYTLRIVAGGVATGVALSVWLLAFSIIVRIALAHGGVELHAL